MIYCRLGLERDSNWRVRRQPKFLEALVVYREVLKTGASSSARRPLLAGSSGIPGLFAPHPFESLGSSETIERYESPKETPQPNQRLLSPLLQNRLAFPGSRPPGSRPDLLNAYQCPDRPGWHIGHYSKRRRRHPSGTNALIEILLDK